jgi:predicted nuclease of predicted toxin-antitoxin system
MKFLIDAQLPRALARHFQEAGYETLHTLDLPKQNRTSDQEITDLAKAEDRVVVTKDADFVTAFILFGPPPKLLLISTGNITNTQLINLVLPHLANIVSTFATHNFIELTRTSIIIHA